MKKYIIINVENGQITPDTIDRLNKWAADQSDNMYVCTEPEEIEDPKTVDQSGAYWGRIDELVKGDGQYTKRGYHFLFLWMCGFGEYGSFEFPDQETGELETKTQFIPDSLTKLGKRKTAALIEAQTRYADEQNIYLPSPEEWLAGKRLSSYNDL